MQENNLLEIKDLHVSFDTYAGEVQVLRGINFSLKKAECLAIVGESGSGKSVTVQSIMKLIPMPPGRFKSGSIRYKDQEIIPMKEKQMQQLRGKEIGMIFQNPMGALNPTMKVGSQIIEGILIHQKLSRKAAKAKALELLTLVGIPNPDKRYKQYPHQFSGGMRQRVVIAIALACNPDILIADEPTTALDVTIQAQILDLLKELKHKFNMSIILITHDLGVVADIAERVIVMYGGEIMEEGTSKELFFNPKHPYTWGLLDSMPRIEDNSDYPLLSIDGTPPDLLNPPAGCPFSPRCMYAMRICYREKPKNYDCSNGHYSRCWMMHEDAPKISRKSPHESDLSVIAG